MEFLLSDNEGQKKLKAHTFMHVCVRSRPAAELEKEVYLYLHRLMKVRCILNVPVKKDT